MRTTIRLDDDLLRQAKQVAAATGRSLAEVVEDSLRQALARRRSQASESNVRPPVFEGGRLNERVDLDDSAGLLELMDRGVAPS